MASEGERGPGTRATRRASVRRPTFVHERGGSWALVSEASNDVASPRLACLAVYVTYKITRLQEMRLFVRYARYKITRLQEVHLFIRYCPFRSQTHTTMDEPQSLLMSPDVFLTPHDSDIELINDTNTCTTQSSDSTISLLPAPLWCLKPPLLRFLTVSDSDSDSLAKTQPYIQCVGPHPYQSWWPRANIRTSALTATPPTRSTLRHNGGHTSSRDMIKLRGRQLLPASSVDVSFNIFVQVSRRALQHR